MEQCPEVELRRKRCVCVVVSQRAQGPNAMIQPAGVGRWQHRAKAEGGSGREPSVEERQIDRTPVCRREDSSSQGPSSSFGSESRERAKSTTASRGVSLPQGSAGSSSEPREHAAGARASASGSPRGPRREARAHQGGQGGGVAASLSPRTTVTSVAVMWGDSRM